MTKLKLGIISAIVVAGVAIPLTVQHNSLTQLREENQGLRQQIEHLDQVAAEVKEPRTKPSPDQAMTQDQLELLRLRGEVGVLKRQLAEAARAPEANTPTPQPRPQSDQEERQRRMAIAKMNFSKRWMLALVMQAEKDQGRFPTNFEQAASFVSGQVANENELTPDQFEIVYHGSLNDLTNRQGTIVIREKEPQQSLDGSWSRAYVFADGHGEVHRAPDGNFAPWEAQHLQQPPQ